MGHFHPEIVFYRVIRCIVKDGNIPIFNFVSPEKSVQNAVMHDPTVWYTFDSSEKYLRPHLLEHMIRKYIFYKMRGIYKVFYNWLKQNTAL